MHTFQEFCTIADGDFFADRPQLLEAAAAIDAFWRSDARVMNVSMPTRFGKSYLSTLLSCYLLLIDPRVRMLRVSYSAILAEQFSDQVRAMYSELFYKLGGKEPSIEGTRGRWKREGLQQWSHVGTGVDGTLTGLGFDIAIVDDTVKGYADAVSAAYNARLDYFLQSVLLGRLEGKRKILNVGTRWTVNDWFSKFDADREYILPALVDGHSVNEGWKSTEQLWHEREMVAPYIWDAQYMQAPTAEGQRLLFADYAFTDGAPAGGRRVAVVDPSTGEGGDYFVCGVYVMEGGLLHLVDMFAKQDTTVGEVADWLRARGVAYGFIECNGVGKMINRQLADKGCRLVPFVTRGDKYSRAYAQLEALPRLRVSPSLDAGTRSELVRQTREFPTADHDDLIDNVIMAFERVK